MYDFLKKTNEIADQGNEIDINVDVSNDTILNQPITCEEIKKAVKSLKKIIKLLVEIKLSISK